MRNRCHKCFLGIWLWGFGISCINAQISPGMSTSSGLQFYTQSWTVKDGNKDMQIRQFVMPLGVYVPIKDGIEMRMATSIVNFSRKNASTGATDAVSGLGDLKLQSSMALTQNRNLVLNLAANLPIGQKALTRVEQDVVSEFVAPDLSVRENRFGGGFNFGGTLSFVKDVSLTNLFGVAGGVVYHGAFDTVILGTDQTINLHPGTEFSALAVYGYIGDGSTFQLSPSFTIYGKEKINGHEILKLGAKGQIQAIGTKSFNERKGVLTFMMSDTFRQPTMVLENANNGDGTSKLVAQNIITPNYFVALFSIDHVIAQKLRATFTNVGRFYGPKGSAYGNSAVYEGGLTLTSNLNPKVSVSLGQRFITGSGTSWTGSERVVQGFEVFARSSIRF